MIQSISQHLDQMVFPDSASSQTKHLSTHNRPYSQQHSPSHTPHLSLILDLNHNRSILPGNQLNLTGYNRTRMHRCSMVSCQLSIHGHVLIQERHHLFGTRGVAPIAHEITHNSKERVHLHTSARHLIIGRVAYERSGRARGFDVGEDGVAGGAEGEREEGGADVGGYASDDDLFLACGFDGGAEFGVVPCAGRGLGGFVRGGREV
jgi:hypothetical protein